MLFACYRLAVVFLCVCIYLYIYIYIYIRAHCLLAIVWLSCFFVLSHWSTQRVEGANGTRPDSSGRCTSVRAPHICVIYVCMYIYIYIYIYTHTSSPSPRLRGFPERIILEHPERSDPYPSSLFIISRWSCHWPFDSHDNNKINLNIGAMQRTLARLLRRGWRAHKSRSVRGCRRGARVKAHARNSLREARRPKKRPVRKRWTRFVCSGIWCFRMWGLNIIV